MTTVRFTSIDIGGGVYVVEAQVYDGPFALVTASTADGRKLTSRLDMQKAMFLDELPGDRTSAGMHKLVERLSGVSHG